MNKWHAIGRLYNDPEVRYSQGATPTAIARFGLAVNRRFKREGEPDADFMNCVAFGKQAEFVEKYLKKGMKIAVAGRIQTGSYTDKETGKKVYTTDVVVEEHFFCEGKGQEEPSAQPAPETEFMSIPAGLQEELPFA